KWEFQIAKIKAHFGYEVRPVEQVIRDTFKNSSAKQNLYESFYNSFVDRRIGVLGASPAKTMEQQQEADRFDRELKIGTDIYLNLLVKLSKYDQNTHGRDLSKRYFKSLNELSSKRALINDLKVLQTTASARDLAKKLERRICAKFAILDFDRYKQYFP